MARGAYSPQSQIRVRVWTWDQNEPIDQPFFQRRIASSVQMRQSLRDDPSTNAYREIHAESDRIPGLILDRYGPYRVVQFLSQGVQAHRDAILEVISTGDDIAGVYERSDTDSRRLEGLTRSVGTLFGDEPPDRLPILENDRKFMVDIRGGHKTGFYLDQRRNRQRLTHWISGDVLDAFCYTGAFTVVAMSAGARSIVSVDSSAAALEMTAEHIDLNGLQHEQAEQIEADVFSYLRTCRDSRQEFDTIILDPPKFAATTAHVDKAARGYKDINLLAFKILRPGGCLITFSCSGGITSALFEKIVSDAALDAGVESLVVATLDQAEDHPVSLFFPEGRYLKGLICKLNG